MPLPYAFSEPASPTYVVLYINDLLRQSVHLLSPNGRVHVWARSYPIDLFDNPVAAVIQVILVVTQLFKTNSYS